MPAGVIDDPKHWRARAGEARRLAAEMPNDMSKQMMLGVAAMTGSPSGPSFDPKDNAQIGVGRLN